MHDSAEQTIIIRPEAQLTELYDDALTKGSMVGRTGFEPATFCTSSFQSTLRDFYEFQIVDLQRAEKTAKEKIYYVRRFFNEVKLNPVEVRVEDIRHYLRDLNSSNYVYKNVLGALKVFFRDFLNRSEVVNSFKFPRPTFKPKIVPTKDELKRFFDSMDSKIGKGLFLLYASSGLRKSEVLELTKDSIDFRKRMIIPSGHSGITKSSYVSFYNGETENALSKLEFNGDKLFKVSDRQYKKIWKNAKRRSGVHITAQRLREWFCCEMGNLGVSDRYIDAFCGRTPKSVLARHYTDYNPERLKKIYDKANLMVFI
jgi:integrase